MSVLSAGYDVVVSRVPAFLGLLAIVLVVGFASQSATASSTRSVHDASVRHAAEVSEGDRVFGEGVGVGGHEILRVGGHETAR